MSHSSVVARELGIPAVVNARGADERHLNGTTNACRRRPGTWLTSKLTDPLQRPSGDLSIISAEDPEAPELLRTVAAGQTSCETASDRCGMPRTRDERGIAVRRRARRSATWKPGPGSQGLAQTQMSVRWSAGVARQPHVAAGSPRSWHQELVHHTHYFPLGPWPYLRPAVTGGSGSRHVAPTFPDGSGRRHDRRGTALRRSSSRPERVIVGRC